MADIERTYTIPLRRDFIKVPKYRRAKRAISQIKQFITKHMKTEDVKIGKNLNEYVWENGIRNPPGKVMVKAIRTNTTTTVELEGHDYTSFKAQTEKTEEPTSLKDKLASTLKEDKKEETVTEKPSEEKKAETKKPKKTEQKTDDTKKEAKKTETTQKTVEEKAEKN